MSSKPNRSTLPETPPPKKTSVATPSRISKFSRGLPKTEGDLTSSLNNSSRLSLDRSASRSANSKPSFDKDTPPKSVAAKTLVDRRSPRLTAPPEKIHAAKESENQAKLNDLQEDLKKAKEQLALLENEKAAAVSELKEAKRIADVANEKLNEALVAQKRAEEDSEIEKFRALEIEQVGTEITQKKEEEWMKEMETIRSQHAIDVEALLSTTLELQRLKEELSMTLDAKNQALCHADDANKIAEVHAEKAEMLSVEVNKLKALLDSKVESEAYVDMMVTELKSEVAFLKQALEKTIILKEKIAEQDETLEQITSGSCAFPFNTGRANNTPAAQPLFGNSNPFGSTGSVNDTNQTSMAEDSVQATSPAFLIFGQPSANASSFGFMGPTPSGSSNSFQFGSQQNLSNPSLFQAFRSPGGFSAGGSFSLGNPTGGDKSNRRIIMLKKGRRK